jgi:predicted nucleic acid-binding protein
MAEIGIGVDRQPNPARRLELARWLDLRLRPLFAGRVIESDEMTWLVLLRMIDRTKAANRTIPVADLIIAAAAERHGLIIVTRNVKDFAGTGVQVLNPWLPSPTPVLA